ncbi:MAG: winged helix DNA-binding domain-containing protein [Actinomycetota bacterium]
MRNRPVAGRVLGPRALNRALLERQLLLRRRRLRPLEAVEWLVALQAQVPRDPYVALWSRLEPFRSEALSAALADRQAVRMTFLRGTLHFVTARDAVALRPLFQPVVERAFFAQRAFRRAAEAIGPEFDEVLRLLRERLEERPRTRAELADAVAGRWPDHDASSLASAVFLIPTVQVTPRGLWRTSGRPAVTTLERWLGAGPDEPGSSLGELVSRYLAVFGPATPADATSWSGVPGMREVFERLRPRLRTFRDDRGRELFDVPRAPLPDPEAPAPVRFLPEYDNALIGHEDRTRIIPVGAAQWTEVGWGSVLVDGFLAARWRVHSGQKEGSTLRVEPFRRLTAPEQAEVTEEGVRLLRCLQPDAGTHDVRLVERIEPAASALRPNSPRAR